MQYGSYMYIYYYAIDASVTDRRTVKLTEARAATHYVRQRGRSLRQMPPPQLPMINCDSETQPSAETDWHAARGSVTVVVWLLLAALAALPATAGHR